MAMRRPGHLERLPAAGGRLGDERAVRLRLDGPRRSGTAPGRPPSPRRRASARARRSGRPPRSARPRPAAARRRPCTRRAPPMPRAGASTSPRGPSVEAVNERRHPLQSQRCRPLASLPLLTTDGAAAPRAAVSRPHGRGRPVGGDHRPQRLRGLLSLVCAHLAEHLAYNVPHRALRSSIVPGGAIVAEGPDLFLAPSYPKWFKSGGAQIFAYKYRSTIESPYVLIL